MKLKFINIAFFLFTAIVQTASAAQSTVSNDYYESVGLAAAQPVKLIINDDLTRKSLSEFEIYQEERRQLRHKSSDFALVKAYILETLKIDHMAYTQIENWISKPVDVVMPHLRTLSLPLETLAGLLSTKAPKPITTSEIEAYLADARKKLDATTQFEVLQYFGIKTLQIPSHELDGLCSWVQSDHNPMAPDAPRLLKCDFGLVLDIFSGRAGRDIRKEFEKFEGEYREKQTRVNIRQDLEAYFMQSGPSGVPMPMMTTTFVNESLWSHRMETHHMAMPKEFDISMLLAEKDHPFLSGLFSNMNERFRVFKQFIICRQLNPIVEIAHPELNAATLVTFKDSRIYLDGAPLNTTDSIWSLSPYNELCILPQSKIDKLGMVHHSYFFQKDQIGIPLAGGGRITVNDGKITFINDHSGHYGFVILQLFLAISYFHEMNILDENLTVTDYLGTPKSLKDILGITKMIKFSR